MTRQGPPRQKSLSDEFEHLEGRQAYRPRVYVSHCEVYGAIGALQCGVSAVAYQHLYSFGDRWCSALLTLVSRNVLIYGLIPSVIKRRSQPVKYGRFPDLQGGLGKI